MTYSSSINKMAALTLLLTLIGCSGPNSKQTDSEKSVIIGDKTTTPSSSNKKKNDVPPLKEKLDLVHNIHKTQRQDALTSKRMMHAMPQHHTMPPSHQPIARDNYQSLKTNGIKQVINAPLSTFSIDVDTGSYANVRRFINQGQLPPVDAVRVEEMLNYFDYEQPEPINKSEPFSVSTEMMNAPWNYDRKLLKIALKGYELPKADLGRANLVFLLDVSGSMNSPHKLPLLKRSLTLLTNQLNEHDRVSIVVYAGAAGVVLTPTAGNQHAKIAQALNKLSTGGSTNGGQGIELAYNLAKEQFIKGGINRVILATDGDFNVGVNNIDDLKKLITDKRKQGITLTTLGFGQGNYNDYLMEQIADIGNGNYAYIDNINEARKVLVDQLSSTLKIIAHDVKIQVEFNPNIVSEYRLIGYENRALANEDFNNDKVDAGEIGAGHQVTALYELTLHNAQQSSVDSLRYQNTKENINSDELAFIKLRYKLPQQQNSQLINRTVSSELLSEKPSQSFKFASAVAAFSQSLKGGKYLKDYSVEDMITLAKANKGVDNFGYRSEFIQLLRAVKALSPTNTAVITTSTTKDLSSNVQTIN
jgi:Ca-activated chloride channel family protein